MEFWGELWIGVVDIRIYKAGKEYGRQPAIWNQLKTRTGIL